MGNCNCTCLKSKKEEAQIEIANECVEKAAPMQSANKAYDNTVLDMRDFKAESVHLIQTQSIIRAYLTRKVFNSEICTEFPNDLVELPELPSNLLSEQAALKFKELGPYEFSEIHTNVIRRGPIKLPDGRIYVGDWSATHEPHGNGTIYFPFDIS